MNTIKDTLLIDARRSFLDGRPAHIARNGNDAVKLLSKHEGQITSIWMDNISDIKVVLEFLKFRKEMKYPYPVNMINIHCPDEAGWQILSTKLQNIGYRYRRETIRENLGAY